MLEWSDLRYFIAVAQTGSTAAAAQALRVSQTTVARRVSALEAVLGVKLIERLQTGSRLTPTGEDLLPAAEQVEVAVRGVLDAAQASQRRLAGVIRFTMPPEAVQEMVSNPVRLFMEQHPGVRIELLADQRKLDIAAGEADVALRAGNRPTDPELIVRKLFSVPWAGYCSPGYRETHGPLCGAQDIARHAVIGADGPLAAAPPLVWLAGQTDFAFKGPTIQTMANFAMAGVGVVMLPVTYGDHQPGLVRCLEPVPEMTDNTWIVTRDDVRRRPVVRAFIDFIVAHASTIARLA
jgi:DNA-binding transcriptional LysR family regulator